MEKSHCTISQRTRWFTLKGPEKTKFYRHVDVCLTTFPATCVTGGRQPRRWLLRGWSTCPPSTTRSRPSQSGERHAGVMPPTDQRARGPGTRRGWSWATPPCPGSWRRNRWGCSGRRWGWWRSPTLGWSRRVTSAGARGARSAGSAGARAGSGVSTVTGTSTSPAGQSRLTTAAAVWTGTGELVRCLAH